MLPDLSALDNKTVSIFSHAPLSTKNKKRDVHQLGVGLRALDHSTRSLLGRGDRSERLDVSTLITTKDQFDLV